MLNYNKVNYNISLVIKLRHNLNLYIDNDMNVMQLTLWKILSSQTRVPLLRACSGLKLLLHCEYIAVDGLIGSGPPLTVDSVTDWRMLTGRISLKRALLARMSVVDV